ncbi:MULTISPECIES: hypothetical protein [Roseobacteraceae]|jgi:hypothetical protein|uniref:Rap1a immunity protein domain-containing protein n=1 Tax=Pseudosulfitobacter pseudonitzschiae TaxID=1402135 RepID=A0A221JWN7_9RHOB|nr:MULTISPECIES: hypothetical protein [Roseobacteraceae]ASM71145.1 hypothetical protein SULPSESMR1_00310 [Pseudosulfitobacter pseudonitzschiae]
MKRWFVIIPAALLLVPPVMAQVQPDGWSAEKCSRYSAAWAQMTSGDMSGVSDRFLDDHAAFLASGCLQGRVCPVSDAEYQLADTLALMAVAEGMAGSFLPFSCAAQD